MQTRRIAGTLTLCALLLTAPNALAQPADVLLVDDTAMGMDDGSTWLDAFVYLQDALAEADARNTDGDGSNDISEIWVAEGTYWPDLGVGITPGDQAAEFVLLADVALYGGFSGGEPLRSQRNPDPETNNTILDGDLDGDDDGLGGNRSENSDQIILAANLDANSILDGFTVRRTGDIGSPLSPSPVLVEAGGLTVRNCLFTENRGADGGAIRVKSGATPTMTDCIVEASSCRQDGGAIFVHDSSSLFMRNCTIRNNETMAYDTDDGGGISVVQTSMLTAIGCRFEGNTTTGNGGAAQVIDSTVTFINCEFFGNHADTNGGGVNAGGSAGSTVTMINCLVARNDCDGSRGGGISSGGAGTTDYAIVNTTIVNNEAPNGDGAGIGLGSGGTVTIANSIAVGNTDVGGNDGSAQIFETTALSATVARSNVQGGVWAGTGNISTAPMFVNFALDDYHLNSGSPCINAGADGAVPTDDADLDDDADTAESVPLDLDGNHRFRNGAVDMGAFESDFCTTDLNALDGTNINDLLALLARWGACGAPCYPDTDGDGDVDINDLLALLAAWGPCP